MNQFMLLFIGESISPTEFKVSYFPINVTYADYEYSTTTGQTEITLLSSYNSYNGVFYYIIFVLVYKLLLLTDNFIYLSLPSNYVLSTMTFHVHTNVTTAQQHQSKQYMNRQTKGVTSFHFKIGDIVLKRNMRNIGRKGGKLEPQ